MKKSMLFVLLMFFCFSSKAQNEIPLTQNKMDTEKPKLVVGIVVDQMRYDYLTRFFDKYGEGGFKRLMEEGYNCAEDKTVLAVGSDSDLELMSPRRMLTTTFADENRLFTQLKGKTIGISIKDRGAILPAGHSANAAYWFRGKDEGNFITTNYYMETLPKWVNDFNASRAIEKYLKEWNTLYDISTYTESGEDLNDFEGGFQGKETATFPYDLKKLSKKNGGFDILKGTPYGNSIIADFAIEALKAEQLGKDNITDVLTVSFSSTDYVGHNFGVNSKEIEDTYIRLDKELKRFFEALDIEVGVGEYTLFLTADHGAVDVPAYLQSLKIPSGYLNNNDRKEQFHKFLNATFGTVDIVENISNNQIFINREKLKELDLDLDDVQEAIVNEQISYPHISKAYTAITMASVDFTEGIEALLQKGYNQKRSGDVILVDDPAYISYHKTGSTHGSGLNYDTHVPLLFFGKGIKHGQTYKKTEITDIAPTISALLGISFPNAAIGQPLEFVFD